VRQDPGWTVVRIDIECSGLLEMSVFGGLLLFYPAWTVGRRAWMTLVGWVITFVANVMRVLFIIAVLHVAGKRSIFVAHTVGGRLVFFMMVAALYWVVFTRGTVRALARRLEERMRT